LRSASASQTAQVPVASLVQSSLQRPTPCPPLPEPSRRVAVEDILPQKAAQTI
jgi:hypothetical protein